MISSWVFGYINVANPPVAHDGLTSIVPYSKRKLWTVYGRNAKGEISILMERVLMKRLLCHAPVFPIINWEGCEGARRSHPEKRTDKFFSVPSRWRRVDSFIYAQPFGRGHPAGPTKKLPGA